MRILTLFCALFLIIGCAVKRIIDFNVLLLLLLFLLILFFTFRKLQFKITYKFGAEFDDIEEKNNLLKEGITAKKNILHKLPSYCERISFLFDASQKLIEKTYEKDIFGLLINISSQLFTKSDNILLFILHKETDSLELVRSLKKKDSLILEKNGDIIDKWILKHNQSLISDNLREDFRFDCNKSIACNSRNIRSIIASPFSIGDKILGTLRVENKAVAAFSMEDLRILRSICDLGVVVLERAHLFKRAEELAIRDSLTALFLRDYFFKRMKEEIRRTEMKKTGLGIIMIDIDDFKTINDGHGHIVGDIVLRKLSRILLDIIGNGGNLACRFGGEEFIIYCIECNRNKLLSVSNKIIQEVRETAIHFRKKTITFTVSVGAVLYPEDGWDILGLIDRVDELLYKAKHEGKNRLCFVGG